MNTLQRAEVDRFLASGNHDDILFKIWPGDSVVGRAINGDAALRSALISAVRERAEQAAVSACQEHSGLDINAREKFAPMVQGLFPQKEQAVILNMLERSVIFLAPATINTVLEKAAWLKTAWDLANIYLASLDARPLSEIAPDIVGLSEETTCFVSMKYFSNNNPLEDYVIHEAAHIFHNCKRETVGLPETRRREWLLEIDYAKRETFAYACEAYSRILELGETRSARSRLLSEHAEGQMPPDDRVEGAEYVDILREAVAARNGWKRILERCAPPKQPRRN
ncbi:MAG: hypothetical protein Q8O64_05200 [Sideroxyarcus sp.]|nr:hypothetical protein [Sideroxyarcus sp.]